MDETKHTTLVQPVLGLGVRDYLSSLGGLRKENINAIKYNNTTYIIYCIECICIYYILYTSEFITEIYFLNTYTRVLQYIRHTYTCAHDVRII